jgi:hypothetical protein
MNNWGWAMRRIRTIGVAPGEVLFDEARMDWKTDFEEVRVYATDLYRRLCTVYKELETTQRYLMVANVLIVVDADVASVSLSSQCACIVRRSKTSVFDETTYFSMWLTLRSQANCSHWQIAVQQNLFRQILLASKNRAPIQTTQFSV